MNLQLFLIFPLVWIIAGIWMVIKTRSRGLKADLLFVIAWPLHWTIERGPIPALMMLGLFVGITTVVLAGGA